MLAVVLEDHRHLVGVGDDVVVGDDIAGGIDDEAGSQRDALRMGLLLRGVAERLTLPAEGLALLLEEAAQELVERRLREALPRPALIGTRILILVLLLVLVLSHLTIAGAARLLGDGDVDDGRRDLLDQWREARQLHRRRGLR